MAAVMKPGSGPLDYGSRTWLKALFAAIFFMLYVPIVTLVAFSFNTDKRGVVWRGFTFDNYVKAWNNAALIEALTNSLVIAFLTTIIATVIGAMLALLLWRFRFPLKSAYEGFMALPIVIPEICMGVALLLFFVNTGMMGAVVAMPWPLSLANIVISHVAFCFPFVAVVVRSRLVGFNRELEEASKDLGASEWQPSEHPGALHEARPHRRGAARLHPVARRLRHHLLHLRPRDRDLPGQGLFARPPRRLAGNQRRLHRADRHHRGGHHTRHENPGAAKAGQRLKTMTESIISLQCQAISGSVCRRRVSSTSPDEFFALWVRRAVGPRCCRSGSSADHAEIVIAGVNALIRLTSGRSCVSSLCGVPARMTVAKPMKVTGVAADGRARLDAQMVCSYLAQRKPDQMSGGQRRRAARPRLVKR
jgi:ABC-type nitrate/sulfonate/bicarbonate transport system permease component